jgi:hypothetical protein
LRQAPSAVDSDIMMNLAHVSMHHERYLEAERLYTASYKLARYHYDVSNTTTTNAATTATSATASANGAAVSTSVTTTSNTASTPYYETCHLLTCYEYITVSQYLQQHFDQAYYTLCKALHYHPYHLPLYTHYMMIIDKMALRITKSSSLSKNIHELDNIYPYMNIGYKLTKSNLMSSKLQKKALEIGKNHCSVSAPYYLC